MTLPLSRSRLGLECSEGVHPDDDPATPALRRKLTIRLLVGAIHRYEDALAAARFFDSAYPVLALPKEPLDETDAAERRAWRRLRDEYDQDFDAAERAAIASHIQNLYADVALEGCDLDQAVLGPFFERAIRFEGTTYATQYDVADYEAGTNIVATIREGQTYDLADLAFEDRGS